MILEHRLTNGVRIVMEKVPYIHSVSVGIWIGVGSRNESNQENGLSHLIEHLLFKGTEKRSAKDIAEEMDAIGGHINAFTTKEYTCIYSKVLDRHINRAFDVLTDMFFNSKFDVNDIKKEKTVIVEEIRMYEDTPEEIVHDLFSSVIWGEHPLGRSILGTEESIMAIKREYILNFYDNYYIPDNVVISIVGNIEFENMLELINKYFCEWNKTKKSIRNYTKPTEISGKLFREKECEQVHLCLGTKGIPLGNKDFYPFLILNNIIGGGMSSRLFQKIREDLGLTYSIYSYQTSYTDSGLFSIYAGMHPKSTEKVIEIVKKEIVDIKKYGITSNELNRSKEQIKGNLLLSLESSSSRMSHLGKSTLILDRIISSEEIISKLDNVSMESIFNVIENVFGNSVYAMAAIWPKGESYNENIFNGF